MLLIYYQSAATFANRKTLLAESLGHTLMDENTNYIVSCLHFLSILLKLGLGAEDHLHSMSLHGPGTSVNLWVLRGFGVGVGACSVALLPIIGQLDWDLRRTGQSLGLSVTFLKPIDSNGLKTMM